MAFNEEVISQKNDSKGFKEGRETAGDEYGQQHLWNDDFRLPRCH